MPAAAELEHPAERQMRKRIEAAAHDAAGLHVLGRVQRHLVDGSVGLVTRKVATWSPFLIGGFSGPA